MGAGQINQWTLWKSGKDSKLRSADFYWVDTKVALEALKVCT